MGLHIATRNKQLKAGCGSKGRAKRIKLQSGGQADITGTPLARQSRVRFEGRGKALVGLPLSLT
eukprot:355159-Chlamydomonas_euryale.AAC.2